MTNDPQRVCWQQLYKQGQQLQKTHLRDLFAQDTERFTHFSRNACGVLFDFSREKINKNALDSLLALADVCGVAAKRDALFAGEYINSTEQKQVLHPLLRGKLHSNVNAHQQTLQKEIETEKVRFLSFAKAVRSGLYSSSSNQPFTDVVHIGIGGSDLGPRLLTQALAPWHNGPKIHFVSNIDSADLLDTLTPLAPATTLLLVSSKSFATAETMRNYQSAKKWLTKTLDEDEKVQRHIVAVTAKPAIATQRGIAKERIFTYWDWVGGRYSVWSAVGLPVAIAIGSAAFEQFLAGGRIIDTHFMHAPLAENIPVLAALIGVWRRNCLGHNHVACTPYAERLSALPAYIQQLEMESNGKSMLLDGTECAHATAPVVFGGAGANTQHSFFQMLHQSTTIVPVDFFVFAHTHYTAPIAHYIDTQQHHNQLVCDALAQASALAFGLTEDVVRTEMQQAGCKSDTINALASHRVCPGNRPSSMFIYSSLTPHTLGNLLALLEYKTIVQGFIWGINSFDQWGVELGKGLAAQLLSAINNPAENTHALTSFDAATQGIVSHLRKVRADE